MVLSLVPSLLTSHDIVTLLLKTRSSEDWFWRSIVDLLRQSFPEVSVPEVEKANSGTGTTDIFMNYVSSIGCVY